jgi:hypothetical protein
MPKSHRPHELPAPPARYQVLHVFGHEGKLIGPWNAEKVAELPEEKLEEVIKLKYVRPIAARTNAAPPPPDAAAEPNA